MSLIRRVLGDPAGTVEVLMAAGDAGGSGGGDQPPPEDPGSQEGQAPSPAEAVRIGGVIGTTVGGFGGLRPSIGGIVGRFGGGAVAGGVPVTSAPSTVFVELGAAAEQAAITREGVQVPVVQLNPAALGQALGGFRPVISRVVSQSIEPGVSVAKGTTVDITLAEPFILQVGVLQNAFQPLATQTMAQVYTGIIRDNDALKSVLARNASATALSQEDQATVTAALTQANAAPGTAPGTTIDAAFSTLQAAYTFSYTPGG